MEATRILPLVVTAAVPVAGDQPAVPGWLVPPATSVGRDRGLPAVRW